MDSKTALRGPNASAGPFAIPTANAARPRARSTRPLFLTSSGRCGLLCNRDTGTYPWTSRTGRGYHLVLGLRAPSDHEFLNPSRRSGVWGCCDRAVRSVLLRSHRAPVLVLAVLSGRGINVGPNSYNQPYSLVLPPSCLGVEVEAFWAGSC